MNYKLYIFDVSNKYIGMGFNQCESAQAFFNIDNFFLTKVNNLFRNVTNDKRVNFYVTCPLNFRI